MVGSRDPQKQLWSYHVNLDKRVRSDHPLRKLNEVLKLDFVREEVGNFYGMKGNVSEDPAVIMKMMIICINLTCWHRLRTIHVFVCSPGDVNGVWIFVSHSTKDIAEVKISKGASEF